MFFYSTIVIGQNIISENKSVYKSISFGEKINFGLFENSINWAITNLSNSTLYYLNGNQINDHIFETPGRYQIEFSENLEHKVNECFHPSFPKKIFIEVSSYKMKFDFSKINFSKNIVGQKELQNLEVSVDVFFQSFNNVNATFSKANIIVAGVGSNIFGSATNDKIILTQGINKIVYRLNGIAAKDTYIMLDFFDINYQIQSYAYPAKL